MDQREAYWAEMQALKAKNAALREQVEVLTATVAAARKLLEGAVDVLSEDGSAWTAASEEDWAELHDALYLLDGKEPR